MLVYWRVNKNHQGSHATKALYSCPHYLLSERTKHDQQCVAATLPRKLHIFWHWIWGLAGFKKTRKQLFPMKNPRVFLHFLGGLDISPICLRLWIKPCNFPWVFGGPKSKGSSCDQVETAWQKIMNGQPANRGPCFVIFIQSEETHSN